MKNLFGSLSSFIKKGEGIILVFFLIRLVGITNPPLEIGHNWRQTLTNMIARNFYQGNPSILYPKVDVAGTLTGIIGSEFPIFNFIVYLFFELFGFDHWYGRLINLTVSSIGIYFFYKVLKSLFNYKTAYFSTLILLSSIWFAFSRKIMPDTFSVSLVMIGLYFIYRYIKTEKLINLILFFLFASVGCLSKIPALTLLSLLIVPVLLPLKLRIKVSISIATALIVCAIGVWYFYWVPHLIDTYGFRLFYPKSFTEGLNEIKGYIPELLSQFYFNALSSFVGFGIFLTGLFFLIKERKKLVLSGFVASVVIFAVFIIKTGAIFPTHNYYIVPFVPIMAVVAGYGMSQIPIKYAVIIAVLIIAESIANQQHDFFIDEDQLYKLEIENIAAEHIEEDELILINGGYNPQLIYFTDRTGWTAPTRLINKNGNIDSLRSLGAQKLIIDKHLSSTEYNYSKAYTGKHFEIYDLLEPEEL
ncbi:ArnT family glycosyltransferase [Salibacter halophilus]|uniref:Glycosyltransferase RgtA/B/C/D-like domain-containing protein n=1 Tax=Salibacter halophilus TaxID=1803916 RepID=A0A6N6M5X3_9FLAO|nr:glycosyltransferase family 39 protein [Salibacter halophilus]KAB1063700.1 hypothetical protein F3059_09025 [Salibacter halophilus]